MGKSGNTMFPPSEMLDERIWINCIWSMNGMYVTWYANFDEENIWNIKSFDSLTSSSECSFTLNWNIL